MTQVYKFGGASIATPERMKALLPIIRSAEKPLLVVVSAYGKTTNALEKLVEAILKEDQELAEALSHDLEQAHLDYAHRLLSPKAFEACHLILEQLFNELHFAMEDTRARSPYYIYDQVVCMGELLSSTLLVAFLKDNELPAVWKDIREILKTDDQYREARVDEIKTRNNVQETFVPLLSTGNIVVTQGFIGRSSFNASTTLGREGSDYTGALMAAMLPAKALSIWKDVEGLLNADPRKFKEVVKIPEITFHEVIEMAFYGAQVIHPKTIKPLQNANIPLWVKCFLNPKFKGTRISNTNQSIKYPPLIVLKENQTLLEISSRDFSFFNEGNLSRLYNLFFRHRIKINLIQNAAITVIFIVDNQTDKLLPLIASLGKDYRVRRNDRQTLLTVRHYTEDLLEDLTRSKNIKLTQKNRVTVQMVLD